MNGGSNDAPGNLMRLHQPSWGIDSMAEHAMMRPATGDQST
jgi:hypothetical protein